MLTMNQGLKPEETHKMNKHARAVGREAGRLAEDARALVAATADVAGEKIEKIRGRLAAALEHDKGIYHRVRDQAVADARVADRAMHTHPYQAAAIGIGCGALIGLLIAHRFGSHHD
jgi:ElaB/YqjD/DUF883 family membrane-anchored ribosome-binding protein